MFFGFGLGLIVQGQIKKTRWQSNIFIRIHIKKQHGKGRSKVDSTNQRVEMEIKLHFIPLRLMFRMYLTRSLHFILIAKQHDI